MRLPRIVGGFLVVLAVMATSPVLGADLWVAGWGSHNVLRYDADTGAFLGELVPNGTGGLRNAHSIRRGPDDRLYVTSNNNAMVLRFETNGTLVDTFVTPGSGGLFGPADGIFGPDGNFYVSDIVVGQVLRYSGVTGAFLDVFVPAGSGGLSAAEQLEFRGGLLYVCSGDGTVKRYDDATGNFVDTFCSGGGLSGPHGLLFMPGDDILVGSFGGSRQVLRYKGGDGAFDSVFVPTNSGSLTQPHHMVYGPDGNLYVASFGNNRILRYDGGTGDFIDIFVGSGNGLASPSAILFEEVPSSVDDLAGNASSLEIQSIYPNPARGSQTIELRIEEPGTHTVGLFDAQGRLVQNFRLTDRRSGSHSFDWNGRTASGQTAAGVYYLRPATESTSQGVKIVRLR